MILGKVKNVLPKWLKVIRHVSGFWIELLENKDVGIFSHLMTIHFFMQYRYHVLLSQISTSWNRWIWTRCIDRNAEWYIFGDYSVYKDCFLWNFVLNLRNTYFAQQYKLNIMYHPWSYRIAIDEKPIPPRLLCVLNYLCLPLTKVLFEASFN